MCESIVRKYGVNEKQLRSKGGGTQTKGLKGAVKGVCFATPRLVRIGLMLMGIMERKSKGKVNSCEVGTQKGFASHIT